MGWPQLVSGLTLTAALLVCAVLFGLVQVRQLRGPTPDLDADERRALRRQAWRRLVGCVLMLLLGGQLLVGLLVLEGPAQHLADLVDAEPGHQMSDDERQFARVYGYFWIVFLLLLLSIVLLAAFELWSVRRRGLRARRRLLDDRRAVLEQQVGQIRQERNGDA